MSDSPEPPLEPWWTPRRLYYLAALVLGTLCLGTASRMGPNWQIDLTWLLRPIYHAILRFVGH